MEFLFFYFVFCIAISVWAAKISRNWFGWLLLALVFSPLVCAIFLAIIGQSGQKCPKCAEVVKRDALICRHCGNELQRQPA